MTLQLLHSEFPYISGKFDFLFCQCKKIGISEQALFFLKNGTCCCMSVMKQCKYTVDMYRSGQACVYGHLKGKKEERQGDTGRRGVTTEERGASSCPTHRKITATLIPRQTLPPPVKRVQLDPQPFPYPTIYENVTLCPPGSTGCCYEPRVDSGDG